MDTILTLRQTSVNNKFIIPFSQYWRGVSVSALLSAPAFTVYLVSYRQAKKEFSAQYGKDSAITYTLSGILAEVDCTMRSLQQIEMLIPLYSLPAVFCGRLWK